MSVCTDGHDEPFALSPDTEAILADAGLQAMSLDKPKAMTEPVVSCEPD